MAERLWSPEFMSTVCHFLQENAYDGVQAEGIEMARYLGAVPPERRIYDAHNAEFLLQRRFVNGGSVLARLYSRLQWRRLERFERAVVGGSRLTLAVSNHDANQLLALAGHEANVQVVTNAIDASAYTFRTPPDQLAPNLIFVGKLDFRPNVDALRWFIGDVLTRVDGARLFAVGAGPPKWLVRAGQLNNRIAVTGYVPDERPYLARAAALVLPVRTGAGSRLKALIAMASGVPIISTRFGMEGLDAEPGTHFFAAESASEWVTAIRDVLREPDLRRNLACNGRALVEQRYDWTSVAPDIQRAYAFLNV
jgi:glycosyltransferase involved in cell wall biosynthesis